MGLDRAVRPEPNIAINEISINSTDVIVTDVT